VADITPLGNGVFRVSSRGAHQLAWAAGPSSARWVFFDGRVYLVASAGAETTGAARVAHDDMALASPMPATVIGVKVAAGDSITRGDVLIVLEAMKMELPIVAPRDGRIRSVMCKPGELVQPGLALVELE
jgi:biotin carboxyl carrier protein